MFFFIKIINEYACSSEIIKLLLIPMGIIVALYLRIFTKELYMQYAWNKLPHKRKLSKILSHLNLKLWNFCRAKHLMKYSDYKIGTVLFIYYLTLFEIY